MRKLLLPFLFLVCAGAFAAEPLALPLYPEGAPDSNGIATPEYWINNNTVIRDVSVAQMLLFLPENPNGRMVVICPGGGYGGLAVVHEGTMVAEWLNKRGIAAVVVKYRQPNFHREIPLEDLHTAIRTVRARAAEWKIDPAKVGVMGSSAGGHLASTALVHYTAETRPDFAILVYPVISMNDELCHTGSRDKLLGPADRYPAGEYASLLNYYTAWEHVTPQTPATFLVHCADDTIVDPRNCTRLYDALYAKGVPAELHIYPKGNHGWGWRDSFPHHAELMASLGRWLDQLP